MSASDSSSGAPSEIPNGVNKRSLRNFFVAPEMQLRHSIFSSAIALTATAVLIFIFLFIVLDRIAEPGLFVSTEKFETVYDTVRIWGIALLSAVLVLSISSLILALRQSHRVAGPIYKIDQFLEDLVDGHFEARLQLRENDEMQEIAEKLNELAKRLDTHRPWTLTGTADPK